MSRDAQLAGISDSLSVIAPDHSVCAARVRIEWHAEWSEAVTAAFAALPYDHLMDPALVRAFWEDGQGRDRQRIALVRAPGGEPVGVVPLRKRGQWSWQLLTQYVMPYARFFVRPDYTDAALDALGSHIDCDNVAFYELPVRTRMLRPEESWVVALPPTYEELMRRTKYARKDRQCRQHAGRLTLLEDQYVHLPEAMNHWQQRWAAEGSHTTAGRKNDLLLGFQVLAGQGRLKTFSLHDGDTLAAMVVNLIGPDALCFILTMVKDEYKQDYAGIRNLLASMEWGCANGMKEYDMLRTLGHYKRQWAEPQTRGYRVIRRPLGSEALGCAVEGAKGVLRDLRHKRVA